MKKRFYKVSSLVLSSMIGLLGFNSCKTAQGKQGENEQPRDSVVHEDVLRAMYGVISPLPKAGPDKDLRVVYGPPRGSRYEEPLASPTDTTAVYDAVEKMPEFPGGIKALLDWIGNGLDYPEQPKRDSIQGRVIVTFIVERDGSITHPEVARSIHPLLDAEALRIVGKMPKWTPGQHNGVNVRVKYTMPVAFKLE